MRLKKKVYNFHGSHSKFSPDSRLFVFWNCTFALYRLLVAYVWTENCLPDYCASTRRPADTGPLTVPQADTGPALLYVLRTHLPAHLRKVVNKIDFRGELLTVLNNVFNVRSYIRYINSLFDLCCVLLN